MANDYVPIPNRVRVVDCPWPASELLLLMQSGDMRIESSELRGPLEEKAVLIRKAMRHLAEAVRERCVDAIELRRDKCPDCDCDEGTCERCAGLKYAAQDIQGLEL